MESPSVALLGRAANETNPALAEAWCSLGIDCALVDPTDVRRSGRRFDAVVPRLDVLPTLDGVEPGLLELLWLERAGMRVLNPVAALLGVHDKLRTAVLLARAGIPHPKTTHLHPGGPLELPRPPVVLKPRFGSWGEEVRLCKTRGDIRRCLDEVAERGQFRRHGVLVQEAVPSPGYDLRLLVAGGIVVGGIERVAAPGEWRTNISVGGGKRAAHPTRSAPMLAAAAAAAIGADLVGVDLLPLPGGGYTVIELNGAVEFDEDYSLPGGDVYRDAAAALGVLPRRARDAGRPGVQPLVRPGQAETTLVTTLARPLHFPESLARP